MKRYVEAGDLSDVRERLEDVAVLYCADHGGKWQWDETFMHLTILDRKGDPALTLHVERIQ